MTAIFEILWDHYIFWSVVVSVISFGWLFHHSFWFRSEDGKEVPNVDNLTVGVFPVHNDDMRLEVTWTILPFILIIWLTYVSWQPLDAMWTSSDGGLHGYACEDGSYNHEFTVNDAGHSMSENQMDDIGIITSDCYHVIGITGQQWFWTFDCMELGSELCDTGMETMEVYGNVPVLHLKKGETYLAVMESQDVTHAPWFQHLGTKEDVLPGQETHLWLPIVDSMTSESMMLCAEYCGDAHSIMAAKLVTFD
jgi:heme/copper-type cytochrome/quinol oxidase subunit 2